MKSTAYISIGLAIAAIIAIAVGLWLSDTEEMPRLSAVRDKTAIDSIAQAHDEQPADSKQTAHEATNAENDFPNDADIFEAQFTQIADSYMDTAQFPVGSQPIRDPIEVYEPAPFEVAQFRIPFPMQSGRTLNVKVALDKFQYFEGEQIQIQLSVNGAPSGTYIEPVGSIANAKRDLSADIQFTTNNNSDFVSSIDTQDFANGNVSPEMLLKVLVKVDGEEFFITQGFQYFKASADVIGVGRVETNGANLDIPLKLDVEESGYYFVRGVLEDAATNRPLIALQTEGRLAKGSRQLVFQAHVQALKFGGSEGPYNLRSIKLYRGADQNEEFDVPGKSLKKNYEVKGFSFNQYDDVDHVDPIALERAAFLRSLGN